MTAEEQDVAKDMSQKVIPASAPPSSSHSSSSTTTPRVKTPKSLKRSMSTTSSWLDKRVRLISDTDKVGVVRRAGRGICTVEFADSKIIESVAKEHLILLKDEEEEDLRRNLDETSASVVSSCSSSSVAAAAKTVPPPLVTTASASNTTEEEVIGAASPREYNVHGQSTFDATATQTTAFHESVKRHVLKRRDLLKKRPNIQQNLIKIEIECHETEAPNKALRMMLNQDCNDWTRSNDDGDDRDINIIDLAVMHSCEYCDVEKAAESDLCWNGACAASPAYCVQMSKSKHELEKQDEEKQLQKSPVRPKLDDVPTVNPMISFELEAREKWISKSRKRRMKSMSPRQLKSEPFVDGTTYRWLRRINATYDDTPLPLVTWKSPEPKSTTPGVAPTPSINRAEKKKKTEPSSVEPPQMTKRMNNASLMSSSYPQQTPPVLSSLPRQSRLAQQFSPATTNFPTKSFSIGGPASASSFNRALSPSDSSTTAHAFPNLHKNHGTSSSTNINAFQQPLVTSSGTNFPSYRPQFKSVFGGGSSSSSSSPAPTSSSSTHYRPYRPQHEES